MANGNGHHWSKFSWRDWHNDIGLHECSLAARGFWMELLCIMHEGSPVGHLTINGKPATTKQMASRAGCTEKEATKLLAALEEAAVFSRVNDAPDGVIYCRRMVNDAGRSEVGREYAEKRWNGHTPNGSPNGSPNAEPTREANGRPNAKSQNVESEEEQEPPPKSPPASRGGRRRGAKPLFRNGFSAIIAEEGMPSQERRTEKSPALAKFLALGDVKLAH